MKTTISKSAVMTRAWSIYNNNRNMFPTFSLALTRAWKVEKQNAADKAKEARDAAFYGNTACNHYSWTPNPEAMHNYYHGAGSANRYFGD